MLEKGYSGTLYQGHESCNVSNFWYCTYFKKNHFCDKIDGKYALLYDCWCALKKKHWRHFKAYFILHIFVDSHNQNMMLRILVEAFNLIWPYFIITVLLKVVTWGLLKTGRPIATDQNVSSLLRMCKCYPYLLSVGRKYLWDFYCFHITHIIECLASSQRSKMWRIP